MLGIAEISSFSLTEVSICHSIGAENKTAIKTIPSHNQILEKDKVKFCLDCTDDIADYIVKIFAKYMLQFLGT